MTIVHSEIQPSVAVLELEPEPQSVAAARAFVGARVEEWGLAPLALDASLVTSELVSNAVIHARTAMELRVLPVRGGLRVEVRDSADFGINPVPTGRLVPRGLGLQVVSQVAERWGVDPVPDGKTVWAELTSSGVRDPHSPQLAGPAPLPLPDDWPEVRLVDVPTRLLVDWEEHMRNLMREFSLISSARRDLDVVTGEDPVELVVATLDRYWGAMRPVWAQARPVGRPRPGSISFVAKLPERVITDGPRFLEAMDAADDLSRQGRLLTEPARDELVAFRRWFVHAVVRQVASGVDEERAPFGP
ncbi:MAG: ATP-binding protein [Acidimicrobiales bacterium]